MSNENSIAGSFFMAGEMVLVHVSVTCMQAKQHALIGSI